MPAIASNIDYALRRQLNDEQQLKAQGVLQVRCVVTRPRWKGSQTIRVSVRS